MERRVNPAESLPGIEALKFAETMLAGYSFEQYSDEENIWFVYHYSRWLAEVFSHSDYGVLASEIKGTAMPGPIKRLLKNDWRDEEYYLDRNYIYLEQDNEFEYVPPVIPRWEELNDGKNSFLDIMEEIESEPEILRAIQLPKVGIFDGVKVAFEHGYSADGFGLEFRLRPDQIKVIPFGSRGTTESVNDFAAGHKDHTRLLAKTAAELSLLAASEQDYSERTPVHPDRMDQLMRRLTKIEVLTPADIQGFRAPGGLKELAIKQLVDKGLIQKPSG